LSDYILRNAKVADAFVTMPFYLKRFAIIHRPRKQSETKRKLAAFHHHYQFSAACIACGA
jgi:hypothetical protein